MDRVPQYIDLANLEPLHGKIADAEANLQRLTLGWAKIDEVAFFLPRLEDLAPVLGQLMSNQGVQHYDRTWDTVSVLSPDGPYTYTAEYHFLRTPWPFRIELLIILGGHSPAHVPYLQAPSCPLVHVSFKCPTIAVYDDAMKIFRWWASSLVQECSSIYGRFAYCLLPWQTDLVYFKPRVNLRDAKGGA